ncbi:ribonuclease-domain-containing protein [Sodiomyces alkalinus F11]|uniref:ribonuclease T1 n=1 Tax=Sodiomyces alkalinus (strain CBS 110278 / VKM F-3762 / F11) TaxID=1314773 RepID=A0A3N2PV67_SODAK|nr:ribonuclease-domain-containing protein [Sodiomyces alkalinus F11]ROT38385.1 ribonuclease-domain-containing protein [Sodiomyces alkalinus F11]
MQLSALFVSLLAVVAQAAPAGELEKRSTTCGSTYYSTYQINAARNAACIHIRAGTTAGGSTYPHAYNNYEGFRFPISGPYQLFPLRTSSVYNGESNREGAPGPDRVIINRNSCDIAGQITHTGAPGNAFVGCSGTY